MTTSPSTVTLIGAKGGVGTSTVAAMYALTVARTGQPVRLSATNSAGVEDLATILPHQGLVVDHDDPDHDWTSAPRGRRACTVKPP